MNSTKGYEGAKDLRMKRRGRPPKSDLVKAAKPGKPGRPKGTAGVINEYKARMLASPKSVKVLEAIFDAALDSEHKNQAAAWKLIVDRIAPLAAFETEFRSTGGRSAVQINITGLGGDVTIAGGETDGDSWEESGSSGSGEVRVGSVFDASGDD